MYYAWLMARFRTSSLSSKNTRSEIKKSKIFMQNILNNTIARSECLNQIWTRGTPTLVLQKDKNSYMSPCWRLARNSEEENSTVQYCASQTWSPTCLAGWSALAVECLELLSMRLHTICHTSRKTNHLCSTTLFLKIQNAVLILSQDTQERIAQESLLR